MATVPQRTFRLLFGALLVGTLIHSATAAPEPLLAGAARVDVTHPDQPAASAPLHARALVLSRGDLSVVILTLDVVAIGGIGPVKDDFLPGLRRELAEELQLDPRHLLVNASHCHGIVCEDVLERSVAAVVEAWENRVPVRAGAGRGHEDRVSVNRRLLLRDGREIDVRHAYSMPPDEEIASLGPIDPSIGILRLDRETDGTPLALLYHFAVHPIQGVPGGGNTADLTGFASDTIEKQLGHGSVALFLQGCAGDINPVLYKAMDRPRDAEPLGNLLALSTLEAARAIETRPGSELAMVQQTLSLPRADHAERIAKLEGEIDEVVKSLRGTTLDFKTFLPLYVKYHLSGAYPSAHAHRYLQDEMLKKNDWSGLDETNRRHLDAYLENIRAMEELTRLQINLALLEKHQARNEASGKTAEAEVLGLRVGEFRLVSFPGELTVANGLEIQKNSPYPFTFVAGYSNGYLHYAPTPSQWNNRGYAQEDSDCLLAPEWQALFLSLTAEILEEL